MKIKTNSNVPNIKNKNISFKGFYNNQFLLKNLKFAANNPSHYAAAAALAFSTIRPLAILATPKTDKENKKIACAKSLASSAIGYTVMAAASAPIADAIKKIDETPSKYLKKMTVKNLQNNAKDLSSSRVYQFATQIFKLGTGFVMAIPKSMLTCTLIPVFMGAASFFLGKDKNEFSIQDDKNKKHTRTQKSKVISFKGLYNKSVENIANKIGKIIDTKPFQSFTRKFYQTNFTQHIMSLTDTLLTMSFVGQVAKSKKIKKERKKPLIHNSLISTGLCIAASYGINHILNKPTEHFIEKFSAVNKNLADLPKYVEGIKIVKPIIILGGIYYIFIPLISTFAADRTSVSKTKHM